MKNAALFLAFLVIPTSAAAQEPEEKSLDELAVEALGEMAGGVDRLGQMEMSSAVTRKGAKMLCATTPAYNSSGSFIGLTYWQVNFSEDGTEVKSVNDVTGLNHECYGSDLKKY